MKFNEFTAVSTSRVLLVPYDRRHVSKYHAWMEDPAIQEATASERLTLEEEYENQESWRASHDKLTFIICRPAARDLTSPSRLPVTAGEADTPERMVGDINFFLYPYDDDGDDAAEQTTGQLDENTLAPALCVGEVDIMLADPKDRGRGLGRETVSSFLYYILQNLAGILKEYQLDGDGGYGMLSRRPLQLSMLMVKIKADNRSSIALFTGLGFKQEGDVNYFGEVKLILQDLDSLTRAMPEGYAELVYFRPEQ